MDFGLSGGGGAAAGGILDGVSSLAGSIAQFGLAGQQDQRAKQLADLSKNATAPLLQKEYQQALNIRNANANAGLPDLQSYNDALDNHMANSLRSARENASSGSGLLAYLSAANGANNNSKIQLDQQDETARVGNKNALVDALWQVGGRKDVNEEIKRQQQARLNAASGAESAAATQNKYGAATGLFKAGASIAGNAIAPGLGSLAKGAVGAISSVAAPKNTQVGSADNNGVQFDGGYQGVPPVNNPYANNNVGDGSLNGQVADTTPTDSNYNWGYN